MTPILYNLIYVGSIILVVSVIALPIFYLLYSRASEPKASLSLPRSLSDFSRNSLIKLMRLLFNQINLYIKNNMLCCHKTRSPTVC